MDLKPALKDRYAKTIRIELSIKPDDKEEEQTSDLAPEVKDDHEKEIENIHQVEESLEDPETQALESPEQEGLEEKFISDMIEKTPKSQSGTGRSLHDRAREVMVAKQAHLAGKKSLKK